MELPGLEQRSITSSNTSTLPPLPPCKPAFQKSRTTHLPSPGRTPRFRHKRQSSTSRKNRRLPRLPSGKTLTMAQRAACVSVIAREGHEAGRSAPTSSGAALACDKLGRYDGPRSSTPPPFASQNECPVTPSPRRTHLPYLLSNTPDSPSMPSGDRSRGVLEALPSGTSARRSKIAAMSHSRTASIGKGAGHEEVKCLWPDSDDNNDDGDGNSDFPAPRRRDTLICRREAVAPGWATHRYLIAPADEEKEDGDMYLLCKAPFCESTSPRAYYAAWQRQRKERYWIADAGDDSYEGPSYPDPRTDRPFWIPGTPSKKGPPPPPRPQHRKRQPSVYFEEITEHDLPLLRRSPVRATDGVILRLETHSDDAQNFVQSDSDPQGTPSSSYGTLGSSLDTPPLPDSGSHLGSPIPASVISGPFAETSLATVHHAQDTVSRTYPYFKPAFQQRSAIRNAHTQCAREEEYRRDAVEKVQTWLMDSPSALNDSDQATGKSSLQATARHARIDSLRSVQEATQVRGLETDLLPRNPDFEDPFVARGIVAEQSIDGTCAAAQMQWDLSPQLSSQEGTLPSLEAAGTSSEESVDHEDCYDGIAEVEDSTSSYRPSYRPRPFVLRGETRSSSSDGFRFFLDRHRTSMTQGRSPGLPASASVPLFGAVTPAACRQGIMKRSGTTSAVPSPNPSIDSWLAPPSTSSSDRYRQRELVLPSFARHRRY